MKRAFHTSLLIFFCSIISFGQKTFNARVFLLDKKVVKGIFYQADEKGVYLLPHKVHLDRKKPENNIPNLKFIDYRLIKSVYLRRPGMVPLGILLGVTASLWVGAEVSNRSKGLSGIGYFFLIQPVGPIIGGSIASISKKFIINQDAIDAEIAKTKLNKFAWYHAEKDTLTNK
jgi:hypothetical protein